MCAAESQGMAAQRESTLIDSQGFYITSTGSRLAPAAASPPVSRKEYEEEGLWWLRSFATYLAIHEAIKASDDAQCQFPHVTVLEEARRVTQSQWHLHLLPSSGVAPAQGSVPRALVWGFLSGSLQRPAAEQASDRAAYKALVSLPEPLFPAEQGSFTTDRAAAFYTSTASSVSAVSDFSTHPDTPLPPSPQAPTSSPHATCESIRRDLGRTFPTHCAFATPHSMGQAALYRVLRAYGTVDPEVGYCQGMSFVAAVLLIQLPEEESFQVLRHLMYSPRYCMRELYLPGFPLLHRLLQALERLVQRLLPLLAGHFAKEGVSLSHFASQWLLTLFAYHLPMPTVVRVWDAFLLCGWRAVLQVCVALLHTEQEALLTQDMEKMLTYLKRCNSVREPEELLRHALAVAMDDVEKDDDDGLFCL